MKLIENKMTFCTYRTVAYHELRIYNDAKPPYNESAILSYSKLGCFECHDRINEDCNFDTRKELSDVVKQ